MKPFLSSLIVLCIGCGSVADGHTTPIEPYCTYDIKGVCVHEYTYPDNRYCTYDVAGICVWKKSRFIELDLDFLVESVLVTETYVNGFYPNLNLIELGRDEGLRLHYNSASNNRYAGTYGFLEANIWVRDGEGITRRMVCMDTYFVAMHELLHFVNDKFIMYDDQGDGHMVPNLFRQAATEKQPITIEGLTYFNLSNKCGYDD